MALKDFIAVIQNTDVARSNRFVVEIQPPTMAGLKPQEQINLMCQDVSFPGQNIRTSTDDLRQGPTRDIAQAVTYGNTNMTFICTPGLPEKLFFEAWQKLMYNSVTWQAKYYRSYIGQIKLRQLDKLDMVRYGIILHEAYPKIINAQDYSNTSADTIQTLQVEFAFHHWAMDTEVYDNTKRFGSEGGADQDKLPKRKSLAGTEDMSAAEAMAFIRGETRNTLGQTYGEAMAAAGGGTGAGQVAANLLTGGAANIGVFKGFQQAFGTLPAQGKHKGGQAVDAELVPAQKEINDGAKTPKSDPRGTYNYFTGWSNAGGKGGSFDAVKGMDAEEMYGRETEVTVYGDAVAWQSSPTGKKYSPVKAKKSGLTGCLLPIRSIADDPIDPNEPVERTLFGYGGPSAYETKPTTKGRGTVAASKLPKARAAAWINPNTGEAVGGGKVNVAATLSSMKSTLGRFFPGSYSGSLASTSSGVLKQAKVAASISRNVGGVKISATISLGGGGGGGLSNLISPRGLMSGIGIPRFGGIPILRGAGFQVRSVASRGAARGGRANHNAEGGESGDGPGDR